MPNGGNPFFVGELLRALEEEGVLTRADDGWRLGNLRAAGMPSLLRQVIAGRLSRLDEEAQRLLAVAAVIGQEVPLAVWAAVAEVDEDALLDVVEPGVEAHLLAEAPDGSGVRFVHALIREALYEGLLATRRRRIHRQVGEALIALADPDPDAVAYHLRQAGDARAAAWLVTAGERAQRAYAWLTAAERYEAAIALLPETGPEEAERGWLLYRVSRLRRWDDAERSIGYLNEALQVAETSGDRALAALARFTRGVVRYSSLREYTEGFADEVAGVAAMEALSLAERDRIRPFEPTIAALPRAGMVLLYSLTGQYGELLEIAAEIAAQSSLVADGPATGVAAGGVNATGAVHWFTGRIAEAKEENRRSRDRWRAMRNYHRLGQMLVGGLIWMLVYDTDHVVERQRLAAEGEDAMRRASAVGYSTAPGQISLPLLILEGQWEEARPLALAALANHREMDPLASASSRALLAQAQGDVEIAWQLVDDAVPGGAASEPGIIPFFYAQVGQRLAVALCLDAGEMKQARAWLDAHDRWLAWSGAVYGLSDGQALWVRYYRQSGDTEQAWEHAQRALAHATEPRQPLALIAAHRLLGELDTEAGRFDDAETHLAASLALADACAAPYERALTLLAMAELRAATGETDAARTLLDEVKAICTPLGAKPTLARADSLAEIIAKERG